MSDARLRSSPLQLLFVVLGVSCLAVAPWVALATHEIGPLEVLGSAEGRQFVMLYCGGAAAFFFGLATWIHLKR